MASHLAWWSTDSHASRCLSNRPILSCYQRFAEKANIHREVGKLHTPSYTILGVCFGYRAFCKRTCWASFNSTLFIKKNTCTIHVPSKWLEYLFPATASSKTSCFCESEVLQPRNMNNILPTQINPQPSMNTLGSHPSRDGVTVYQVLKAKTPVATNKFTWQMQLACRYRNVYAPEKQRGSPKNHPIEFRKIIWTKPPCLGSMWIFQGVSGALHLMQYEMHTWDKCNTHSKCRRAYDLHCMLPSQTHGKHMR